MRRSVAAAVLVAATTLACGAPLPELPSQLATAVSGEGALAHLRELQRIADDHGGNRAVDTPGYDASVDYVAATLRAAGYEVQTPSLTARWSWVEDERLTVDGAPVAVEALDYSPATPADGVSGPLMTMADEGCAPADAFAVLPGSVALVRSGTCTFTQKAANAAAAGAVALVVIKAAGERWPGDGLSEGAAPAIPTGGVSPLDGDALAAREGTPVTLVLATTTEVAETHNVLAQTRTGDPTKVILAGAHLDSVHVGAGINDNGSGVAALLETAVHLGGSPTIANAVRFAFWGAEEVGLRGSSTYVRGLDEADRAHLALYVNLDMVASPNTAFYVYDGDDSDGEGYGPGPPGSAAVERVLVESLAETGVSPHGFDFDWRSDYVPFLLAGIPSGGLFTGAEKIKTPAEAQSYGGTAGAPLDPCYHQACDRIDNINRTSLDRNTDAVAMTVARFALSTAELTAG